MGPWARGRTGRSRLRWEEPLVRSMGIEWWRNATEWRPPRVGDRRARMCRTPDTPISL